MKKIVVAFIALSLLSGCHTASLQPKTFSNFDNNPHYKWESAAISSPINFSAADNVVTETNNFINANFKYIEDKTLYGKSDYWATPTEFLANKGGDCEDFAIAKYATLAKNGVDKKNMRLLLVKQSDGQHHAILEVKHEGKIYFLDNKTNNTTSNESYHTIYAVNDYGLWY